MSFLKRSVLAARILFYVLMASLVMFMGVTSLGVLHEQERIMTLAHADVEKLVQRNSASLAGALWNYDTGTLQTLLRGMSQFGPIIRLSVRDEHALVAEASQSGVSDPGAREWVMPLYADNARQIGTLTVTESHSEVRRQMANTIQTLAITELVKILGLTVVLFTIVYRLIARHVSHLAAEVSAIRPQDLTAQVQLQRRPSRHRDELDTLTQALNSYLRERAEEMQKRALAESLLRERMTEMEVVLAALSDGVIALDADCRVRFANTAARQLLGCLGEDLTGQSLESLFCLRDEHTGRAVEGLCARVRENGPLHLRGHVQIETPTGRRFDARVSAVPVPDSPDVPMIVVFTDISAEISKERQIEFQAYHDPLTQLGNRSLLARDLGMELEEACRGGYRLAVLCADLDNFKNINDALGHTVGDLLLKDLADRLRSAVPPPAWVTRHGGDEFIIVLPRLHDPREAEVLAQTLMQRIGEVFLVDNHQLRVTASVGVSLYPDDGQSMGELLSNADMAMYDAKRAGRNLCRFYENTLLYRSAERLAMENGLRVALSEEELFLVFQPKVLLATGEIPAVEALLRWRKPSGQVIPPATFIPVAEDCGLIIEIGDWVLRAALAAARRWQAALGRPVAIAVNVSPIQFRSERLLATLEELAAQAADLPHLIELELTESALAGEIGEVTSKLAAIHRLGLKVAIDDFGTGYSSLAYLKNFPIDILKIDQAFIRELHINTQDQAIVASVVALGKSLGFTIVAEGVEDARQVRLLTDLGCDYGQGYWFARPLEEDLILARLGDDGKA